MNWNVLRVLYLHEVRMLVRTRRLVVMSVLLPAVLMPAILIVSRYSRGGRERTLEETTYRYAITGPLSEQVRMSLEQSRDALEKTTAGERESLRRFSAREVRTENPAAMVESRNLHFYIHTSLTTPTRPASGSSFSPGREPDSEGPHVTVTYRGDNDASQNGAGLMVSLLTYARQVDTEQSLSSKGFPVKSDDVFTVDSVSTATAAQVSGAGIGRYITLILVVLLFTGGSIAAMDIIAGEKESGTLETLLTTAAGRHEIVAAKQLAISSVAAAITLIQALNFLLYVRLEVIPLPPDFDLQITWRALLTLLVLYLPLAAAIAATLLIISTYAKTYKEAQMYFFPVYLAGMVPALAAALPGLSLRSAISFVPVANVSIAVREILTGRPDNLMILVTVGVMTATAAGLMWKSARLLSSEDVFLPGSIDWSEFDGGPGLFQKRVLAWFAVMWAVIFAAASGIPQLASFRTQMLFNEVVIFLGASLLMIRVYRLNVREALALRPVKPVILLAILVAIPFGSITAHAVFQILNFVIPISQRITEQFSQAFLLEGIPQWQVYLYAALIPAVCEEVGFRGILLHGLRKRFRPVFLPVIVGLIFGMFHFTLFRIAPTAFLGMVISAIALLTGSIFPGMLLHLGNNAFGLWAASKGISLDGIKWWQYTGSVAIFAAALYVIYRNRTPYPDTAKRP